MSLPLQTLLLQCVYLTYFIIFANFTSGTMFLSKRMKYKLYYQNNIQYVKQDKSIPIVIISLKNVIRNQLFSGPSWS